MEPVRPRRKFVRRSGFRDARLVVIACEGEKTEPGYFQAITETMIRMPSRVHVEILTRSGGFSAPEHVLTELDSFKRRYSLLPDDELWAVIDYDRWGDAKLSGIAAAAKQKGYRLAVSRPCFEFWLLLHHLAYEDLSAADVVAIGRDGCDAVIGALRSVAGGYSKKLSKAESYVRDVDVATARAAALDTDADAPWPEKTGTRVYLVIRSIQQYIGETP